MDNRPVEEKLKERYEACQKAIKMAWQKASTPLDIQYNQAEIRDFRPSPKQICEISGEMLAIERAIYECVTKPAEEFARKAREESERVRQVQAAAKQAAAHEAAELAEQQRKHRKQQGQPEPAKTEAVNAN